MHEKNYNPKHMRIEKNSVSLPDQMTIPSLYPNARFEKTNVACPDEENVERARNWVEYSRL